MYLLLSGRHPFATQNKSTAQLMEDISKKPIKMRDVFSEEAKSLISSLLNLNTKSRLGMNESDIEIIKNDPFFEGIDWKEVENKQLRPPFVPELLHDYDVSYMERKYTRFSFQSSL